MEDKNILDLCIPQIFMVCYKLLMDVFKYKFANS